MQTWFPENEEDFPEGVFSRRHYHFGVLGWERYSTEQFSKVYNYLSAIDKDVVSAFSDSFVIEPELDLLKEFLKKCNTTLHRPASEHRFLNSDIQWLHEQLEAKAPPDNSSTVLKVLVKEGAVTVGAGAAVGSAASARALPPSVNSKRLELNELRILLDSLEAIGKKIYTFLNKTTSIETTNLQPYQVDFNEIVIEVSLFLKTFPLEWYISTNPKHEKYFRDFVNTAGPVLDIFQNPKKYFKSQVTQYQSSEKQSIRDAFSPVLVALQGPFPQSLEEQRREIISRAPPNVGFARRMGDF